MKFESVIKQAVVVLKKGGVVVYPTDTAYGLAVDTTDAKAVERLYRLKGREFNKPVHVIFPDLKMLALFARISPISKKLIKKFWPGPLTIVLPLKAKGKSWQRLSAGTKTIGVRLPNNQIALELVKKFSKPITTTSANISGQPNCYSIAEVKRQFKKSIYLGIYGNIYFLDGGVLKKTKPSTVVSLVKGAKILRLGPISEKQIKKVLSDKY